MLLKKGKLVCLVIVTSYGGIENVEVGPRFVRSL